MQWWTTITCPVLSPFNSSTISDAARGWKFISTMSVTWKFISLFICYTYGRFRFVFIPFLFLFSFIISNSKIFDILINTLRINILNNFNFYTKTFFVRISKIWLKLISINKQEKKVKKKDKLDSFTKKPPNFGSWKFPIFGNNWDSDGETQIHSIHPSAVDVTNCIKLENTYYSCRNSRERNRWVERLIFFFFSKCFLIINS